MGSKAAVPGSRLDTVRPPMLRAMANARARRPKTESVAQVRSIPGPLRETWFRPRGRRGERNPRSERRDLQKVPERTGCPSRAVAGGRTSRPDATWLRVDKAQAPETHNKTAR